MFWIPVLSANASSSHGFAHGLARRSIAQVIGLLFQCGPSVDGGGGVGLSEMMVIAGGNVAGEVLPI